MVIISCVCVTVKLPSCKKSVKVNFSVTVAEQQEEQRRQTHVHHVVSVAVVSEFSLQHSDPNAPPVSTPGVFVMCQYQGVLVLVLVLVGVEQQAEVLGPSH